MKHTDRQQRMEWIADVVAKVATEPSPRRRREDVEAGKVWTWQVQGYVMDLPDEDKPKMYRRTHGLYTHRERYHPADREDVERRISTDLRNAAKAGLIRKHERERGCYLHLTMEQMQSERMYGTPKHPMDTSQALVRNACRHLRTALDRIRKAEQQADRVIGVPLDGRQQSAIDMRGTTTHAETQVLALLALLGEGE